MSTLSIDVISSHKLNKGINSPIPERLRLSLAATGIGLFVPLGLDMRQRTRRYRKYWDELIAMYGRTCFYCRDQIATSIDHVIPWSWDNDNDITNLVPACMFCNAMAGNKLFEDVEHKKHYILSRRKYKRNRRAICIDCLLPFAYRIHSPSLFLCAECYDDEYDTEWTERSEWKKWVGELQAAEIEPDAHRYAKLHVDIQCKGGSKKKFVIKMLEYYDLLEEQALSC